MTTARLPAAERRQAVLGTACRIFSDGSYRGTTTAEIARESGVSEPILYRHFASKRELYLACLASTWDDIRGKWEDAVAAEPDPAHWLGAIVRVAMATQTRGLLPDLWVQALTEATDDAEISGFLAGQIREVHDYIADLIRSSQAAGGIVADRDADAEAWIHIAVGLLNTVGRRVGGLLEPDDLNAIRASRIEWMLGSKDA
ncbi:MAG: TetR/AcrR family transcriptional regulator [Gaiellaceae bacterium]